MRNATSNGVTTTGAARQAARVGAEMADSREDGVVLTDLSLKPVAIDSGATAIFNDVNRRNGMGESPWSIPKEITEAFRNRGRGDWSGLRIYFRGQKYEYRCTMYRVEPQNGILSQPLVTLHLDRGSSANNAIIQIAAQCCLTPREEEVLTGISIGLTSKEVAQRMNISPNTVKTYLRLIMVKLGVTTRAAIVGKLLNCDTKNGADGINSQDSYSR